MFSIHHTALSVSDIKKSVHFYKQFGFRQIFDFISPDNTFQIIHLKINEFILELFCFSDNIELPETAKSLKSDLKVIWTKHFALNVDNLQEAYDFCKSINTEIFTEITIWKTGIKYFFIKDPDWILVEIVEDSRTTRR